MYFCASMDPGSSSGRLVKRSVGVRLCQEEFSLQTKVSVVCKVVLTLRLG